MIHVMFGCIWFFIIIDLSLTIQSQMHLSHQRQPQHSEGMLSATLDFPKGKRVTEHYSYFALEALGFP